MRRGHVASGEAHGQYRQSGRGGLRRDLRYAHDVDRRGAVGRGRDVGRRVGGRARLTYGQKTAADLVLQARGEHGHHGLVPRGSVEMTVTRRTAASGTETEYHMLLKPIDPCTTAADQHPPAPSWPRPSPRPARRCPGTPTATSSSSTPTSCGAGRKVVRRRCRVRHGDRHEARARDRKQSHESDGDASGHDSRSVWGGAVRSLRRESAEA